MLIRREDFGNIEELSKGSHRKVWLICDKCGAGVLKKYCFYLRQKNGDLCQKCVNKLIGSNKKRKEKSSKIMKKLWENEEYRKKRSKDTKKLWENEEYRKKQKKSYGDRWENEEYRKNHGESVKKAWRDGKYKNHGKKIRKLFEDEKYREKRSEILKGIFSRKEYEFRLSEDILKDRCYKNDLIYKGRKKVDCKTYIKVECENGHITFKDISSIDNSGCRTCSHITSKAEKEIADYIKSLNITIIENDRIIINPFELDIVIPHHKIAIEYCGLYWHCELHKSKNYHRDKLRRCNDAGYRLITIFEDEWLYKKDIVKNRLEYFLNLKKERLYARKCEIREITKEQSEEFVNKYHIQGHANASVYLGAFYNKELVAANTFVKRGLTYELNRFCVNKSVIGIASKFIKYFQRNYEWEEIITFADLRWSEGKLYEKIGFVKDKILNPDYSYFKKHEIIRYHKFNFRHYGMKKKLENYNPNLSEKENMLNNNWLRIYDCGKIRYRITLKDL